MATASDIAVPVLGVDSAGMLLTPDEFDAVSDCDELYDYELVNGVVVVREPPPCAHIAMVDFLSYLLRDYRANHVSGATLDATLTRQFVRLTRSRRLVDNVLWCGLGRRPKLAADAPTIVVEFVSAGRRNWRRDFDDKRSEYLGVGVKEYWTIDRFARTMTVHSDPLLGVSVKTFVEKDTYRPVLLPGFELPLESVLAEADDWRDEE
jgi:Uma2 family endonuclease